MKIQSQRSTPLQTRTLKNDREMQRPVDSVTLGRRPSVARNMGFAAGAVIPVVGAGVSYLSGNNGDYFQSQVALTSAASNLVGSAALGVGLLIGSNVVSTLGAGLLLGSGAAILLAHA